MKMEPFSIDPNEVKTRDYNMLLIIGGATKSGAHQDKRKQRNKNSCREWKKNSRREDDY